MVEIASLDVNAIDQDNAANVAEFDRRGTIAATSSGAGAHDQSYAARLASLFRRTVTSVREFVDEDVDIARLFDAAAGSQDEQLALFLYQVALFLTTFLAKYARVVEHPRYAEQLGLALQYLLRFTKSGVRRSSFHFSRSPY